MGCGKNNDHFNGNGCVCEVVRAIKDIQDNAEDTCVCPTNCFLEPLGSISPATKKNPDTRVFMLKTADGSPFHAFFKGSNTPNACVSIFFRVEDVFDNCCAVLRVLNPVSGTGANQKTVPLVDAGDSSINLTAVCHVTDFLSTDSCITVDLSCFCAIQCVEDIHLGVCED